MSVGERTKARGAPNKEFFIGMITRDISVAESILDLVDNSIDQAVESRNLDVTDFLIGNGHLGSLDGLSVDITISESRLTIVDNCGGIGVRQAKEEIFQFGGAEEREAVAGLSVYGIGMKRAFFKLGNKILVQAWQHVEAFEVDIDVEKWKQQPPEDWSFDLTEIAPETIKHFDGGLGGTAIMVTDLLDGVGKRFRQVEFKESLSRKLEAAYGLFLKAGLRMSFQSRQLEARIPRLAAESVRPARKKFAIDDVDVLVLAGVSEHSERERGGWYVFCNGRMIVEADRTSLTGWGETLPKWHTKYGRFVGYVYFRSKNLRALPWTTTKQGLVVDSVIYQLTLKEMKLQARPVLDFFNRAYPDDVEASQVVEREVLSKAKGEPLDRLDRSDHVFQVDYQAWKEEEGERVVNILFQRPRKDLEQIKKCIPKLKRASAKRIGEYALDYLMERECR